MEKAFPTLPESAGCCRDARSRVFLYENKYKNALADSVKAVSLSSTLSFELTLFFQDVLSVLFWRYSYALFEELAKETLACEVEMECNFLDWHIRI